MALVDVLRDYLEEKIIKIDFGVFVAEKAFVQLHDASN
jgi:hypothetical protein